MNSLRHASFSALLIAALFLTSEAVAQTTVKDYERAAIEKVKREKAEAARQESEQRAVAQAKRRAEQAREAEAARRIAQEVAAAQAEEARQEELDRLGRLCIATLAQQAPGVLLSNCEDASKLGNREVSVEYAKYLYDSDVRSPENIANILKHAIMGIDQKEADDSCIAQTFCYNDADHFVADVLLEFRSEAKNILPALFPPPQGMGIDAYINTVAFAIYSHSRQSSDGRIPFSSAELMMLQGLVPLPTPTIPATIDYRRTRDDWKNGKITASGLNQSNFGEEPVYPSISNVDKTFIVATLVGEQESTDYAEVLACTPTKVSNDVTDAFAGEVCREIYHSTGIYFSAAVDGNGEPVPSIVYFKVELLCATENIDWPNEACNYQLAFASKSELQPN